MRSRSLSSLITAAIHSLYLWLIVLLPFTLYGQAFSGEATGYDYPRTLSELTVNPSPMATAMYRYQDCPVSYATGTAEISIPLLECNSGDLSVSLSLTYHTGGVKVTDEAGYMALGWTLQGLGRISRQVKVMPDESRPFDTSGYTNAAIKDQFQYKTEANYDRYSYDFPGYSGSFIITGDSLVHMSDNGVKIERMCSAKNKFATDSFAIITPGGLRYTFGQREICKRGHWIANGAGSYTDISYEVPVVWNLTSVQSLVTSEKFYITYATGRYDRYDDVPITQKFSRRWSYDDKQDCFFSSVRSYSDGVSRFSGYAVPESIKGRAFTINFNHGSSASVDHATAIATITLLNSDGVEIRKINLDYSNSSNPKKRRLDGIKITSDKKVIDKRTFTYYDYEEAGGYGRDFFGYANGSTSSLHSIVDMTTMELNTARRHDERLVKAWSLKSMTDVTGAITTFFYISKRWTPSPGDSYGQLNSVYNGIAVSKIETRDPLTGRSRTRTFTYSEPVMSVPLQYLTIDDFVSLSGSKTYNELLSDNAHSIYTLTAELTSSCRRAGYPAENMVIYFNKVSEYISGSGVDGYLRTDYEFNTDWCIHDFGLPYRQNVAPLSLYPSTDHRQTRDFSIILGKTIPYGYLDVHLPIYGLPVVGIPHEEQFYQLFHERYMGTSFTERINPQPLLSKKISYEFRDGMYEPLETVENYHSSARHNTYWVGRYVRGNIYSDDIRNEYDQALTQTGAIDVCDIWAQRDLVRLDSTVTTRHFPDGNSRRVVTRHGYGTFLSGALAKEAAAPDSLILDPLCPTPHSTVASCGSEYFISCNARARDVSTPFYRSVTAKGFADLPVMQKWISKVSNRDDSIELRHEYSAFNSMSPLKSRSILMRGVEKTAEQIIKSYDNEANITWAIEADGTSRRYMWLSKYRLLSNVSIETANGSLTSSFYHSPFIGCTSIRTSSGKRHSFSYSGGRLLDEKNSAGNSIAAYDYKLYASDGLNMTEESVFNDGGASTVRVYHDGFGMPVQTVSIGAGSKNSEDVAAYTVHDGLDRPVCQWRPVPVTGLDTLVSQATFNGYASTAYGDTSLPSTLTRYLTAPGERACAVYSPSEEVRHAPASFAYLCNSSTVPELKVRRFIYSLSGSKIGTSGYYDAGVLDAVKSTDPDGHSVIIFTDWRGFKILDRRVVAEGDYLDTYYINDPWGNPLFVLQPELSALYAKSSGSFSIDSDRGNNYLFQYRYDRCGRLISKKTPGCEPETYRYDRYGRLAFMQNGNMRATGKAMFTLYDDASRVVLTGICDDYAMNTDVSIPSMSVSFDNSFSFPGICGSGYSFGTSQLVANARLLTATYYDSYNFLNLPAFSSIPPDTQPTTYRLGLPTGSLTAVMDCADDAASPIATVTYYDNEERPVKTVSTTYLPDTYETTETRYTLDSQPKTVKHTLKKGAKTYTDDYTYVYDNIGRLRSATVSFSGAAPRPVALVSNEYNILGQLKRAVTDGVATSYTYNIRGALKTISSDLQFAQTLYYEDGENPLYSGRISAIKDNMGKRTFSYDGAGRLMSSVNVQANFKSSPYDNEVFSAYYTYDRNSNIRTLDRRGYTDSPDKAAADYVDNLVFNYAGNQLIGVTDNAADASDSSSYDFNDGSDLSREYTYDHNGNLTSDANRGVSEVRYNTINRPSVIAFNNLRWIENVYRADGIKLSSKMIMGKLPEEVILKSLVPGESVPAAGDDAAVAPRTTQSSLRRVLNARTYIGNYEFTGDSLTRLLTPYGYFKDGHFYVNVYDYQGNLVASGGEYAAGVAQENSYYPYGLPVRGGGRDTFTPYLYGGKEFESRQGLNLYDFLARAYAPDEARFWQPDPKAGDYHGISPYVFCGADPVNFIDPDGMKVFYVDMAGRIISSEEAVKLANRDMTEYEKVLSGYDYVVIVSADGNLFESPKLNEGAIETTITNTALVEDNVVNITAFKIRGDEAGKTVFEYLANKITEDEGIEFGYVATGEPGDKGLNFVSTSHTKASEAGVGWLFDGQLKYGYTLRNVVHSHPTGKTAGNGDLYFRDKIIAQMSQYSSPTFSIYHVKTKTYIPFPNAL